jgi:hypothetical protein
MELDQEICASCRRPRDEREIQAGHEAVQERERQRKRRPRVLALRALAAAAVLLVFHERAAVQARFRAWKEGLHRDFEKASDPGPGTPKTPEGAAILALIGRPAAPPGAADAPAPAARPAAPPRPAPAPPEPPQAAHRLAQAAPEPASPTDGGILVYGVVYDLETGFAVPNALVHLRGAASGSTFFGATDADGRYQIPLPGISRDDVYAATARAEGYRTGQLEDPPAPYREKPEAERREALSELTERDLDPVAVRFNSTAQLYPLDLVLAPQERKP